MNKEQMLIDKIKFKEETIQELKNEIIKIEKEIKTNKDALTILQLRKHLNEMGGGEY